MSMELVRLIGRMKYRSSYGQNLLQHSREVANICAIMASELGLNPKLAKRAGLLHDIGKVSEQDPELPHALLGMKIAEQYKEKPEICNAIGAHHEETEMTSIIAPLVLVGDAISGARPGARREVIESYIKRLKGMEDLAASYPGVDDLSRPGEDHRHPGDPLRGLCQIRGPLPYLSIGLCLDRRQALILSRSVRLSPSARTKSQKRSQM